MKTKGFLIIILVVLALLCLYYCTYITPNLIESFNNNVTIRPCTIWFTPNKKECDQGLFHKDAKTLDYMLKVNILEDLDKQIEETNLKIKDIDDLLEKYEGLTLTELKKVILTDLQDKLKQEENKYVSDPYLIQQYKFEIEMYESNVDTVMHEIDSLKQDKGVLENELKALIEQKEAYKLKPEYTILETIKEVKEKDPDFKCKVEFNGLNELHFNNNPIQSDMEKNAYGENILGDPMQWAYCHKQLNSVDDKKKLDNLLQKGYELAKKNNKDSLSGVRPYDAKLSPTISSIMFKEFKQDDQLACFTSRFPNIPNGLLEIKLTNRDTIERLRVVKYTDPRYINTELTKELQNIDPLLLAELLFDLIIEINNKNIKVYMYPNNTNTYKVYYLYYDTKCKQFYGDTSIPYGPSKTGDLFLDAKPINLFQKELAESYTESNVREYLNPKNISIAFFDAKLAEWNKEIEPLLTEVHKTDAELEKNIYLQHIYKILSSNQPETVKKLKIDEASEEPSYKVLIEKNLSKEMYLEKAKEYQDKIQKGSAEKQKITSTIKELQTKIKDLRNFIDLLKPLILKSIQKEIPSYIKQYIGKPIKDFIKSYTPMYISNYNTIYMAVSTENKITKNKIALHTAVPPAVTATTLKEVIDLPYYPAREDIYTFDNNLIISDFKPETYF